MNFTKTASLTHANFQHDDVEVRNEASGIVLKQLLVQRISDDVPSTSAVVTSREYAPYYGTASESWVIATKPNLEDFTFVCLWQNCFQHISCISELEKHLYKHFEDDYSSSEASLELMCPIYGCEMDLESPQHVYRHLKSHLFQAEKQQVGLEHYRRLFPDLRPCGFEKSAHLQLEGDPWVCGWKACQKVLDDLKEFIAHVEDHLSDYTDTDKDEKGSFPCYWISGVEHKQCEQRFSRKASLKVHLRCHSGDRACACPFCGTFLANATKLSDHVSRRQPLNDMPLTCALCQKKFPTNRLLKIHCRKHVKSVKCGYCEVVMDCASSIAKHMKIVHAGVKSEQCATCGLTFGLKTDLQKHVAAMHEDEPQFACRQCPQKFRWEKQLRAHEKTHMDDYEATPYLCHKCPFKYKNGSSLSRHFIKQHSLPLPAGFNRFQYKKCHDGYYRLQTSRCISKNVIEASKY